jgi:hypothetical protein
MASGSDRSVWLVRALGAGMESRSGFFPAELEGATLVEMAFTPVRFRDMYLVSRVSVMNTLKPAPKTRAYKQ